jgi:purine-nucleoside phosphorylase
MENGIWAALDGAFESLGAHRNRAPRIGIVLGSGLGAFSQAVQGIEIPYGSIKGFPVPSVEGHGGILKLGGDTAVLSGRVHYYEGRSLDDVVFGVFLLARMGVRTLILTNAAGGINRAYSPGDLVLLRDHINLMGVNPLRGPNTGKGPRFPDMSRVYDGGLRALASEALGKPLAEGVYAALAGPSYETPAEIRMLAAIGADMVGMSTVPEAIAARYLGMEVLGISCITNMAAGVLDAPLDHSEVMERGREAAPRFIRLLRETIRRLGGRMDDG